MAAGKDWLPGRREAQLAMAKDWQTVLAAKAQGWNIPPGETTALAQGISAAETVFAAAQSSERTSVITAQCKEAFEGLTGKMRFIKNRYFLSPPLSAADLTALELKPKDGVHTARGAPRAQMTAEEAAEWGKTLNFEKVWAAFMETDRKIAEQSRETDRRLMEQSRETDRKLMEQSRETDRKLMEAAEQIKELSKNIGGVNRSLGRWSEQMVAAKLWEKFDAFGYVFTKGAKNLKFLENRRVVAKADVFLENGEYVMPVETKTDLVIEDVNEHIDRINKIRLYMDKHKDKRIIVGAVAGAIVSDGVCKYAQKKGLYVLVQSGDAVVAADMPEDFSPRKWQPKPNQAG